MAKRPRPSPQDPPAPDAADWLDRRMDDGLLDLDVLAAMPADEVRAGLRAEGIADDGFTDALRQRLAGLEPRPTPPPRPRKTDRPATRVPAAEAPRRRWFGLRGAVVVSLVVILAVALGPFVARKLGELEQLPVVVAPDQPVIDPETGEPTRLEGPAPGENLRGVRYVVLGLGRVAVQTPLPRNPGSLEATYELRIRVDAWGNVVGLESMRPSLDTFEPAVIDSLLRWRFEPGRDGGRTQAGTVTIIYRPD